ncbi:MAG: hypothetical protein GY835_05855 [bacterium]|nr:hypothetical protein [bacterium]
MHRIVLLALGMLSLANISLGQTTWTKHPDNPILDLGDPGTYDSQHAAVKSVILNDGIFYLFYQATDDTYTQIALATSSDALNWTKHGIVVGTGDTNEFDSVQTCQPSVFNFGQGWRMYYEGMNTTLHKQIGLAYSDDLYSWTKAASNPVLPRDPTIPEEETGVSQPYVLFDEGFIMYYIRWRPWAPDNIHYFSIGMALSDDGILWTKYTSNPVLQYASPPAWDDMSVSAPFIQSYLPEIKTLWYCGVETSSGLARIGKATSQDGINWDRSPDNPILNTGAQGTWDDIWITCPFIVKYNNEQYMFYSGYDGENWRVGLATAPIQEPNISNVLARKLDPPNNLVEISYDLYTPSDEPVEISLLASNDLGATFDLPTTSVTGDIGSDVTPGLSKLIYWDARRDYPGLLTDSMRVRVIGITEGK